MFHAGSLAGTEHEEEKINRNQKQEARAVNSGNAPVQRRGFRHFEKGGDDEDQVNRRHNTEVCSARGGSGRQQCAR